MAKFKAKGVLIKYGDAATPTTNLGQTAEVDFNGGDRELVESTTHDSPSKEYLDNGLPDTPELSIRVLLDPADVGHEWLRAKHASGALGYMTFVLPDTGAAQWAMSGFIRSLSVSPSLKGAIEASFTFKANVAPTFTA